MKKVLISAASALAMTGALFAGVANAANYDWSGFYLGAQAGYIGGGTDHDFSNGAPSDESDFDDAVFGGHIGYNMQFNAAVVGFEADLEGTTAEGTFQNSTGITSSGSSEINVQGSVRARVGYAMGRLLPYLTAGVAIADIDYGGGPIGGPCCGFSKTAVGGTVGGGLEYAWTDQISARIEYRYTDFGDESDGLPPTFPGVTMPVDTETHVVRVGVSFHF